MLGLPENWLSRRTLERLLAVAMVFSIVALATDATAHFHKNSADEAKCQACHIGHSSAPGPSALAKIPAPVAVARVAAAVEISSDFKTFRAPSIPRAPPA
jgi:hypothetical protein